MTTLVPIHTLKLTVEQFFQLGEDPPGTRLELIDGEIIVRPSPSRSHADIVFALAYLIETHLRTNRLGKLYLDADVVFTPTLARRPDIAYFSRAKAKRMSGDRLDEIPDLCIEVLSPSNENDDRVNKFELSQTHGVSHYWIIDPQSRAAECWALRDGKFQKVASGGAGEKVSFPPFPDLLISLGGIWMADLPD